MGHDLRKRSYQPNVRASGLSCLCARRWVYKENERNNDVNPKPFRSSKVDDLDRIEKERNSCKANNPPCFFDLSRLQGTVNCSGGDNPSEKLEVAVRPVGKRTKKDGGNTYLNFTTKNKRLYSV